MARPPLTDVENVKISLRSEDYEGVNDTLLGMMVEAASQTIREHTGRAFTSPKQANVERTFYLPAEHDRLYLDEVLSDADVISVNSLGGEALVYDLEPDHVDPAQVKGTWLRFSDTYALPYSAFPQDHADWFIREPYRGGDLAYTIAGRIKVRGNWGWTQIPSAIEWQTRLTVKSWYELGVEHFGRQFDAVEGRFVRPEELPSSVIGALRGWQHPMKEAVLS